MPYSSASWKTRQIKRKGLILKNQLLGLAVLSLTILAGFFYLLCFNSLFQIKEIKIFDQLTFADNETINSEKKFSQEIQDLIAEKIEKKILLFSTKTIFFINKDEIEKAILQKFPQIESIDLKRKFPDCLMVKIKERKAIARGCLDGLNINQNFEERNCYLIDKNGIVFKKNLIFTNAPNNGATIIFPEKNISLGQKLINEENLVNVLKIQKKIKEDLKIELKEFVISESKLTIKTQEGWEMYFDLKSDLDLAMSKLVLIFKKTISTEQRKNLQYIDLRYSKIYYK